MRWGLVAALLAGAGGTFAAGGDWTGFRGPTGSCVSEEVNLPTVWNDSTNILWSTPLPGVGNSSPAVTKTRVYVTSCDEATQTVVLIALDRATGAVVWQHAFAHGKLIAYGPPSLYEYRHNPATPSPCADADEHVFAFAGTGELVCMDRDGAVVWQRNMVDDYGPYDLKFGMGSSPRLWGNKLIIAAVHKGPSYVVALNKDTGKELWLADRNYPALGDATDAYTSPMVLEQPGLPPQVIVSGCDHVDAYDLETGRRLWTSKGLELKDEEYSRIIASPAVGDGMVVAASAKAQHAVAMRTDGTGDVTESHLAWKQKDIADCPAPTIPEVWCIRSGMTGSALVTSQPADACGGPASAACDTRRRRSLRTATCTTSASKAGARSSMRGENSQSYQPTTSRATSTPRRPSATASSSCVIVPRFSRSRHCRRRQQQRSRSPLIFASCRRRRAQTSLPVSYWGQCPASRATARTICTSYSALSLPYSVSTRPGSSSARWAAASSASDMESVSTPMTKSG
ncbi:MAG: PQQ-binding-like beta-propeller repeat protein [Planctomycetaceae bacterium]